MSVLDPEDFMPDVLIYDGHGIEVLFLDFAVSEFLGAEDARE